MSTITVATIDACSDTRAHAPHLRMSMVWRDSLDRVSRPLWCLGQYEQARQSRRVIVSTPDRGNPVLVGEGLSVVGSAYRIPREPGECGECREPEDFEWDPIRWVDDGPVIACMMHAGLAPGWAYEAAIEVGMKAWMNEPNLPPRTVLVPGDVVQDTARGGTYVVDRVYALTIDVHDVATKHPYIEVPLTDVVLLPNLVERR